MNHHNDPFHVYHPHHHQQMDQKSQDIPCTENVYPSSLRRMSSTLHSFPSPQRDPNAMDIDNVNLSKLTSTEHARCIREDHCFHCCKTGHNTTTYRIPCPSNTTSPTPRPQNIHHTETSLSSQEIPTPPQSKLDEYVNSLKTSRKSNEEIFSTLKMCYEESPEEIASVALTPGILKAQNF